MEQTQKGDWGFEEELRLKVQFDRNQDREVCILFIRRLLAAQETAFKERVTPDEHENNYSTAYDDWTPENAAYQQGLVDGHNACRQEVLTRIERPSQ